MKEIDDLLFKYAKEVSFLQLKEGKNIEIAGFNIDNTIPLPIVTDKFIEEIKNQELLDDIPLEKIIEGMVYTIGADTKFRFNEYYINILKSAFTTSTKYIFTKGISYYDNGQYELSALYFKTLLTISQKNDYKFYYALSIEAIGKEFIEKDNIEKGNQFINESKSILEDLISEDSSYYPAYYKLGFYYLHFNELIKAKLTWEKALVLEGDENSKDEIRAELEKIEKDYSIEMALWQMKNMDYEKAIDELNKLTVKGKDDFYVDYLLGVAYSGHGNLEIAKQFLALALDKNKNYSDIYNELGIIYFNEGDIKKAIEIFTEGIKITNDDYRLYFNRGLGYLNIGEIIKGYYDIKLANELNPTDENILNQLKAIENFVSNNNGGIDIDENHWWTLQTKG